MRGGLLGGRSVFLSITHSITYFLQNHRGSILAECSSGGSEAFPMFVRECGDTHSRHFPCFVRDRTARVKECRRLASGGGGAREADFVAAAVSVITGYVGGSFFVLSRVLCRWVLFFVLSRVVCREAVLARLF